jgi:hypothetical protein
MKYFTPELLERVASLDDDVADDAQDEWERAIVRSNRHWQKIKKAFPAAVRRFEEDHVCLHDAQVLRMGRDGDTFVMVLEMEPPSRNLVVLTFTLDGEPEIDPRALPAQREHEFVTWLYEEWDLDRGKRCRFDVLLSNGWSVRLCFREFQYLILPPILPARDGQVLGTRSATVPRPA